MTWLLCGMGAAVVVLSALYASERLRRINAERERDAARREVKAIEATFLDTFAPYLPPVECVR
jgi:hypothetical protein